MKTGYERIFSVWEVGLKVSAEKLNKNGADPRSGKTYISVRVRAFLHRKSTGLSEWRSAGFVNFEEFLHSFAYQGAMN
jgi:hypothetical protein